MQNHYNNEKGSLYKFAEDHGLNSWEFDLVKRIVRCRKKGQFREDLEKSKFLIDLYLLEMEEPTPAPVSTYSYSVNPSPLGGFYFTIKDKGGEVYKGYGYDTHLHATQGALEWIKEQEAEPEQEEPTPAPVTTYSYSVIPSPFGYYFRIREKGEMIYFSPNYDTHLDATQAALKWIETNTNQEKEG